MKHLLYFLLLITLLTGCKKDPCYQDSGTILGHDYRKCMCCGGWFIEIEKDTLRFDRLPEGCTINFDSLAFPFDVYLDWQPKDPGCLGDEIIVNRMELKK